MASARACSREQARAQIDVGDGPAQLHQECNEQHHVCPRSLRSLDAPSQGGALK